MITGKIVSLKDRENGAIFPQTSAEAVYTNDGKNLEQLTEETIFFSENKDVIELQRPEILEQIETKIEQVSKQEYITYEMFGAKGDGITNDYLAIKDTHLYANINNKKVKGTFGKNIMWRISQRVYK